jgi:hypothetical protein
MEMSGKFNAPVTLTPEKEPRCLFRRKLGGPQSPSGRCGEENNLSSIPEIEPRFLRLYNGKWHDDKQIMSCKMCERKRL